MNSEYDVSFSMDCYRNPFGEGLVQRMKLIIYLRGQPIEEFHLDTTKEALEFSKQLKLLKE